LGDTLEDHQITLSNSLSETRAFIFGIVSGLAGPSAWLVLHFAYL